MTLNTIRPRELEQARRDDRLRRATTALNQLWPDCKVCSHFDAFADVIEVLHDCPRGSHWSHRVRHELADMVAIEAKANPLRPLTKVRKVRSTFARRGQLIAGPLVASAGMPTTRRVSSAEDVDAACRCNPALCRCPTRGAT